MNRLKLYITSILMSASMLNIGCMSTVTNSARSAYSNAKGMIAGKDTVQTDALYAQVQAEDQKAVQKLAHDLEVTKQTEELAKLERNRDDLQRERSRVNEKRMELLSKEKEHRIQLAKLEAIDKNQLGDKITNIEQIADTHVDALEVQQKRLQLDSEVGVLDVKIGRIETEIESKHKQIEEIKTNGIG